MLASEAIDTIRHALHGRDPSSPLSPMGIVNDAGAHLVNMHPWRWLERYTDTLAFVAGQNYVTLPTDFEDVISDAETPRVYGITMTDLATVARERAAGTSGRPWCGALTYLPFTSAATPAAQVLAVAPTPAANESNAVAMFYRAGWVAAQDDTDWLDIRPFMVPLYKAVLAAYTLSREEGESESTQGAWALVARLFDDARAKDGRSQPRTGMSSGGAMQMARYRNQYNSGFNGATVIGP